MKKTIALIFAVGTLFVAGCSTTGNISGWNTQTRSGLTDAQLIDLRAQGWHVVSLTSSESGSSRTVVLERKDNELTYFNPPMAE